MASPKGGIYDATELDKFMERLMAQERSTYTQPYYRTPPSQSGGPLDSVLEAGAGYLTEGLFGGAGVGAEASAIPAELMGNGLMTELPGSMMMTPGAAAAPSSFSLSGVGSAGNLLLPAAGAAGALDLFANKRSGGRGALQGAASGAAMGSYFGLPGIAIGAGVGGLAGYFGNFGDENKFQGEFNRAQSLRDKGINWGFNSNKPKKGRSIDELIAEAQATGGNVQFAGSRNEGDLKPEDIWGYSAFGEQYGNDWLGKFSESKRRNIAQELLNKGAVREHHGEIDIDWSKAPNLDEVIKEASPIRSQTSSPGISKDGKRIDYSKKKKK